MRLYLVPWKGLTSPRPLSSTIDKAYDTISSLRIGQLNHQSHLVLALIISIGSMLSLIDHTKHVHRIGQLNHQSHLASIISIGSTSSLKTTTQLDEEHRFHRLESTVLS